MEQDRVNILGIDPGRSTGFYCASIPRYGPDKPYYLADLHQVMRWEGNAAITISGRDEPTPILWADMLRSFDEVIAAAKPSLIVIEHPYDRGLGWGKSGQGTEFHLGMFFGFAVLAARFWQIDLDTLPADVTKHHSRAVCPIALVPVTSSKAKQREGWMPRVTTRKGNRSVTHTQDRDTTLRQCRQLAARLFANCYPAGIAPHVGGYSYETNDRVEALSDHELMALGVLTYYITHKRPSEWGQEWKSKINSKGLKPQRSSSTGSSKTRSSSTESLLTLAQRTSSRGAAEERSGRSSMANSPTSRRSSIR